MSYSPFPFNFFPFVEVGTEGLFLRLFNLRAGIIKCGVEQVVGGLVGFGFVEVFRKGTAGGQQSRGAEDMAQG